VLLYKIIITLLKEGKLTEFIKQTTN